MTQTENLNPQQKLISGEIACHIVGFGRTKLNELVKAKKFPQPIRFSQNFVRTRLINGGNNAYKTNDNR